jgi:hypothetical protein
MKDIVLSIALSLLFAASIIALAFISVGFLRIK